MCSKRQASPYQTFLKGETPSEPILSSSLKRSEAGNDHVAVQPPALLSRVLSASLSATMYSNSPVDAMQEYPRESAWNRLHSVFLACQQHAVHRSLGAMSAPPEPRLLTTCVLLRLRESKSRENPRFPQTMTNFGFHWAQYVS